MAYMKPISARIVIPAPDNASLTLPYSDEADMPEGALVWVGFLLMGVSGLTMFGLLGWFVSIFIA